MNSMTEGPLDGPESKPAMRTSADIESAGTRLRIAREAAGLTLDDVAQQLKLARRQVVALESDDVAALPGPTFVRGFIRNYARLLKIDPAPLIEASRPQSSPSGAGSNGGAAATPSGPAVAPTMSELPMEAPRQGAGVARWLIPSALVLLLAAGAGYYQFGGGAGALRNSEKSARNAASESAARSMPSEPDPTAAGAAGIAMPGVGGSSAAVSNFAGTPPGGTAASQAGGAVSGSGSNATMPVSTSGAMAPAATTANPPNASPLNANAINSPNANNNTSATTNPTNVNAGNVNTATASGSPTPASSTSPVTTSGGLPEGRLEFEFAGQAWVEVRDKHGDVLISRTMPAKSKHMLRGELPFTLRVGNASAVSVVLDGRPVDLMPFTRNEIAKLVIPAQNP